MTKVINLTPHEVIIIPREGETYCFPKSGTVARCSTTAEEISIITASGKGNIPLVKTVIGEPQNVPEPEDDTLFIVSRLVKSALPERNDLIVPDGLVRDENGNVIGAERFSL